MSIIEVKNLSFAYEQTEILHHLNFAIKKNTINVLLGLSGSGKTTLCYCLCGIIPQCISGSMRGQILIDGKDIQEEKLSVLSGKIGLVMQNADNQLVTTTVEDELAFGPENMKVSPEAIREKVDRVLDQLQISHLRERNPNQLSAGQKQLVAIGSVLTLDPQILIFDEPMSCLDSRGKQRFIKTLGMLQQVGKTIVIVEHDYKLLDFADQWLVMTEGELNVYSDKRDFFSISYE